MAQVTLPITSRTSADSNSFADVYSNDFAIVQQVNGQLDATNLAANAVTTAKITDANVTTAKIADSAVTTAKVADSNITTAKIADSNLTTAKLADGAVTAGKVNLTRGEATQSADLTANGVVTGCSVTPGAVGTYLVMGSATASAVLTPGTIGGRLDIRGNAVVVVTGPVFQRGTADSGDTGVLEVQGFVTLANAAHAIDLYGTLFGTAGASKITNGRLTWLRVA